MFDLFDSQHDGADTKYLHSSLSVLSILRITLGLRVFYDDFLYVVVIRYLV